MLSKLRESLLEKQEVNSGSCLSSFFPCAHAKLSALSLSLEEFKLDQDNRAQHECIGDGQEPENIESEMVRARYLHHYARSTHR